MTDQKYAYDITEGDWRVTAEAGYGVNGDTTITFYHKGEIYRTMPYPAYRIWNISAHFHDIVADFEDGMAKANWSGFPNVVVDFGGA